jgi:hypothetical protein
MWGTLSALLPAVLRILDWWGFFVQVGWRNIERRLTRVLS